jgi:hypothetical protein
MNIFNILTIIISIIVFLGLFVYTFIIYYNNNSTIFPKDMTSCPDFWTVNPNGTCKIPTTIDGEPPVNIGKLANSQKMSYTVYSYPTVSPSDKTGKKLDILLDISNISYFSEYDDPGTVFKSTPSGTNMPVSKIRDGSVKPGRPYATNVYRYKIPYGYNIRNPDTVDFRDKGWASYGDPYCAIKQWSKENESAWDGISSYNC